jgi:hypothetical protein
VFAILSQTFNKQYIAKTVISANDMHIIMTAKQMTREAHMTAKRNDARSANDSEANDARSANDSEAK